jgi:hypothetical protein
MWHAMHFLGPLRKKHNLSAVGTLRQVSEGFQTLVIGQNVIGKGAELVCVRMLTGMEEFAHGV